MCKPIISKVLSFLTLLGVAITIQSCGKGPGSESGELVGAPNREGWVVTVPFGMVVCPSGTFEPTLLELAALTPPIAGG